MEEQQRRYKHNVNQKGRTKPVSLISHVRNTSKGPNPKCSNVIDNHPQINKFTKFEIIVKLLSHKPTIGKYCILT